jgi:hypothetical protein
MDSGGRCGDDGRTPVGRLEGAALRWGS